MAGIHTAVAPHAGWERCLHLTNGLIDLVATLDVGPRVIRLGFCGGPNEFAEFPEDLGATGGPAWRPYGGHRFWYGPEDPVRTYYPDNDPVEVTLSPAGATLTQAPEHTTGLQKSVAITLAPDRAALRVTHWLANTGAQTQEVFPWGLSVMAPGGEAYVPHPPFVPFPEGLLPQRSLVVWPYARMSDPRVTWGDRLVRIRQDASAEGLFKLGMTVPAGWAAYANAGRLFVKRFRHQVGAPYPDFGCSVEVFTNERMLELESLGPLNRLGPGETVAHTEHWSLHRTSLPAREGELHGALARLIAADTEGAVHSD